MKAAIYKSKGKVVVGELPDSKIKDPTDAVVRVVRACVCGSDLWVFRGIRERTEEGPIGHEFIGRVEEVGEKVKNIKKGDFVIAPFKYSDNTCPICKAGDTANCMHGGGWARDGVDGGQGEKVRVPLADGTLVKVEETDFNDELLASLTALSDVMPTGHHAAVCSGVKPGSVVAVVGDGAVGLCAVIAAKRLGAKRIIALSRNPARQKLAKEFGATDIVEERGEDAVNKVMEMTDGIGVDSALECVGTNEALNTAIGIARPGSVIGNVGLPVEVELPFEAMFFMNKGLYGGPSPARAYIPELLEAVLKGEINPGKVFDLTTDLDHIGEAYAAMDERRAIKSLLDISKP